MKSLLSGIHPGDRNCDWRVIYLEITKAKPWNMFWSCQLLQYHSLPQERTPSWTKHTSCPARPSLGGSARAEHRAKPRMHCPHPSQPRVAQGGLSNPIKLTALCGAKMCRDTCWSPSADWLHQPSTLVGLIKELELIRPATAPYWSDGKDKLLTSRCASRKTEHWTCTLPR